MVTNDLSINGISTVMINYCSIIDLNKFDISLLCGMPIHQSYRIKCKELGIEIVELPTRKTDTIRYYKALKKAFSKGYDIVHIHGNSATISAELLLAKCSGIKSRIAHCHSSACAYRKMHILLLPIFNYLYTDGFACSKSAGKWLFHNRHFEVIPNGFCVDKFLFQINRREQIRKKLEIENNYVIGHIGRINEAKNHPFILRLFEQYGKVDTNAVLLLVGNGPNYEKVKEMITNHPFKNRIIFYGEALNIAELYASMDVFIMPSKYEGLGIVALEAQINGLPCIVSDRVPKDVKIGENIFFCNLDNEKCWLDLLTNYSKEYNSQNVLYMRNKFFELHENEIRKWDICENSRNIERLYQDIYKRHNIKRGRRENF